MKLSVIALLLCLAGNLMAEPRWLEKPEKAAVMPGLALNRVAEDLNDAWGLAFLPDQRLLVSARKPGKVWLLDAADNAVVEVLEVNDHYHRGQGGLFALWVDDDFASHSYIYLAKAVADSGKTSTRLMRYRWENNALEDEKVLFTAKPWVRSSAHFGGAISQDDQGFLYLSIGDRRQKNLPQQKGTHVGTIVRLTRSGEPAPANPFVGSDNPEVFSYGHRNPQGLDWYAGRLLAAEHGPQGGDEVNRIAAGNNYGWPVITYGEQYGGGKIGEGTHKPGMEQPLFYYVPSIATSDLLQYRGDKIKSLAGAVLVASLKAGVISWLQYEKGEWREKQRLFADLGERWRSIKQDAEGRVWLLAESGNLYRLERQ